MTHETFGSHNTQMFLSYSDIVVVVFGVLGGTSPLHQLAKALRKSRTSNDVQGSARTFPLFRPLALVLKYFLAQRGLNETYTGGVGSFLIQLLDVGLLQHHRRSHDMSGGSFLSRVLFSFVTPMIHKGNERQLDNSDLLLLERKNQSAVASAEFAKQFERHNKSTLRAIVSTYGRTVFLCGLGSAFSAACSLFAPQVLRHLINAFASPVIKPSEMALWLGAFFASRLANAIVASQLGFHVELVALRLTVSFKSLIFQKAMRRSIRSKTGDEQTADVSNLYSTDMSNLLWAAYSINNLWVQPVQIGVAVYMLHTVLGNAAFAGLGVIAVSMGVSFVIAKYFSAAFGDLMARKDARMKVVKEVFSAIQIIKLNAWENRFADKIVKLRDHELSAVSRVIYLLAATVFVLWVSPLAVSSASFAVYVLVMEEQLTAAKVFTAIALFNTIRNPLHELPNLVQDSLQAKISLDRIVAFLELDERDPGSVQRELVPHLDGVAISIEGGEFGWSKDAAPVLKNVRLQVKKGDLVVVHGAVGAGKSSLCLALLGETEKLSGSVFVRGKVAYYSQQTWVQNLTIRDNILFGNALDERRYAQVLDACGLVPDLAGFPAGDATELGQKGVNLSGGQKARVCLARACYADADVLILDSPLAAVDAVVQSEIFDKCICSLLEHKTIVLVTHSPDIISSRTANCTILVENGELKTERRQVVQPRSAFASVLTTREVKTAQGYAMKENKAELMKAGRLVEEEECVAGRVARDVYFEYFQSLGGVRVCVFLLLVQTLWQGFQVSSDLWLSHWTFESPDEYSQERAAYNVKIYAGLGAGAALMVLVRATTMAFAALRSSRYLSTALTNSLLHAPLRFFDANPIGRIVNRYADDLASVDFDLPLHYSMLLATFFLTVCQLATAVYMVNFLGVLILPLVVVYVQIATIYLAPSREISRLWKVSSSPVLSHVSQSEEGVVVIRAFGSEYVKRTELENAKRNDLSSTGWFSETATTQWFQVRMQLLGCGVVVIIVSALVYLRAFISAGLVGVAFTYALTVDGGLANLVQAWSRVEVTMVSPERITEYASIPPEGTSNALVIEPGAEWPRRGTIAFDNVVFSYKAGAPPVLKQVSFEIRHNEKIGIVGRTGAGKSSLTMALFRINELAFGRIVIDGMDTSSLPLHTLRSRMSIIPQSPVLFKGSLRAYMDPFDAFSDAAIWLALEKVEMKHQVGELENQLAFEVSDNGGNFSVGERQMLCLARALLTQARIVVMDEATASIDHATEKKLQDMIAREFKDTTVLTIAHRLATVLASDRILVLSDGQVVELDTPGKLLQQPAGVFYQLAKDGGHVKH